MNSHLTHGKSQCPYTGLQDCVTWFPITSLTSFLCILSSHSVPAIPAALFVIYTRFTSIVGPLYVLLHLRGILLPRYPHNNSFTSFMYLLKCYLFRKPTWTSYFKLQLWNDLTPPVLQLVSTPNFLYLVLSSPFTIALITILYILHAYYVYF